MLAAKLLGTCGGGDTLYVDDVFSAYTYTGNGSTQTITNGIDLAGTGGLVWIKDRTVAQANNLVDTVRGAGNYIASNLTAANTFTLQNVGAFGSSGFTVGDGVNSQGLVNTNGENYVSWTFRKAPKFFDVVTYTGTGGVQNIAHSLGMSPGMIIIKSTSNALNWGVYHKDIGNGGAYLNVTSAAFAADALYWNNTAPTSSQFTIGTWATTNTLGATYVAYLFAHDPSADGIIQCGSFTTDASGNATVNLGWEPQYLMVKSSTGSAGGNWLIIDNARGFPVSGSDASLYANLANTEANQLSVYPTSTGFSTPYGGFAAGDGPYIYLAIRCPNKPPIVGTQVFNTVLSTGTGVTKSIVGAGFTPDMVWFRTRTGSTQSICVDRLRGDAFVQMTGTTAETYLFPTIIPAHCLDIMDGVRVATAAPNAIGVNCANYFFKRAPGVFDIVCYTGTGTALVVPHNLGVPPEFIITKSRSANGSWTTQNFAAAKCDTLTTTLSGNFIFNGVPTSTNYTASFGNPGFTGTLNTTYVAYLFATKAGVSKVGKYTGNGTSQTINCGFTTGARFILLKCTSMTGDWYIWDTSRGIVAGSDPYFTLNATLAEVTTDDSTDPDTSGFIVNQVAASNINVNAATYTYLAFA